MTPEARKQADVSVSPEQAPPQGPQILLYALVSACSFLMGMAILAVMVWKAETLARYGLFGDVFYVLLIPLGLAAACFLFGVLRSAAIYSGKALGYQITLGGPIVAAALVVWGGFHVPAPAAPVFTATVYVHGPGGPQDRPLRGTGQLVMDVGGAPRPANIDASGAAYFPGIVAALKGKPVNIVVDAPGFERAGSEPLTLAEDGMYLPVRRSGAHVVGRIQDVRGNPILGAAVNLAGYATRTDQDGFFQVDIAGDRVAPSMTIDVRATGFNPVSLPVVADGNPIRINLKRGQK